LDGSKAGIMVTAILLAVPLADEQALGLAPVSRRDPRTFGGIAGVSSSGISALR